MSWNNRIMKQKNEHGEFYGLHEVFYHEYEERSMSWTKNSLIGYFDTVDELIASLELMLKDANRFKDDVLDYE